MNHSMVNNTHWITTPNNAKALQIDGMILFNSRRNFICEPPKVHVLSSRTTPTDASRIAAHNPSYPRNLCQKRSA